MIDWQFESRSEKQSREQTPIEITKFATDPTRSVPKCADRPGSKPTNDNLMLTCAKPMLSMMSALNKSKVA